MKKAYIFDMDGTITDSMKQFAQAMKNVLESENIACNDKIIREVTPLGLVGTAEYFIQKLGVKSNRDDLVKRLDATLCAEYGTVKLKAGAKEYLQKLKNAGGKLYILTANHPSVASVALKNNGIFEIFDEIWSVFDFGATKGEEKLYRLVAQKLGCTPNDIEYYDDSPIAVGTAVKAGIITYGVQDRQSEQDKEFIRSVCTHYVESFEDLL